MSTGPTIETPVEPFKFRHVHAVAGTFVLACLGVLIAILFLAGRNQRWFLSHVTLQVVLPATGAGGIRQGSEVYFLGTLMGSVTDVTLDQQGRMEAQVKIRGDFFPFVRDDSSAVIKRKFGLVGDAYFEISRGNGKPLPEENATIVCNEELPSAIESAIEELRREAVPALKQLNAGLQIWTQGGSNLIGTSKKLDQLILLAGSIGTSLTEGKGTAGQLLTDPTIANNLTKFVVNANETVGQAQQLLKSLQVAGQNLESASTNFPAISQTMAAEANDLPGLVMKTQIALTETQRLIEAMQKHWLVRKRINPSDPPPAQPGGQRNKGKE